jgi:hypothetical protein
MLGLLVEYDGKLDMKLFIPCGNKVSMTFPVTLLSLYFFPYASLDPKIVL